MKVEVVREEPVPVVPPVKECHITLSYKEMCAVMAVANWNGLVPTYIQESGEYAFGVTADDIRRVFKAVWSGLPPNLRDEMFERKASKA